MAVLKLRTVEGRPLTNAEVDANFTNLNNELASVQANPTFGGDVIIEGDLTVQGNTTTLSAQELAIADNFIYLNARNESTITGASGDGSTVTYTANNNYSAGQTVTIIGVNPSSFNVTDATITDADATSFSISSSNTDTYVSGGTAYAKSGVNVDLGWAGGYNDGTYAHAGFFRDSSDSGIFKVFEGYTPEPSDSIDLDTTHPSFSLAKVQANTFIGSLDGALLNPRTISLGGVLSGSVSFDASQNVTINASYNASSLILGTDTSGNYVSTISGTANEIEVTGSGTETASVTIGLPDDVTITNSINAASATVTGTINAADFNSTSDRNLKENITPLQNALSIIEALEGVSFNWKSSGKESIGVVAQQVESIVPQIVTTDQEGIKRVSYDSIVPILIEAIKELSSKIK